MSHNLLPIKIKHEYEVIYSEKITPELTIFKNKSGSWGVIQEYYKYGYFLRFKVFISPIYYSVGYNSTLKIITATECKDGNWNSKEKIFDFFNLDGELVSKHESIDYFKIDEFGNILFYKNEFVGVFDRNFKVKIEPNYLSLLCIVPKIFRAKNETGWGIIDINDTVILDFGYDAIFPNSKNSKIIVQKADRYFLFDFIETILSELSFDKILFASSNTYKAPSAPSYLQYKTIIDCKEIEYANYEMTEYLGKWGIIDADGRTVIPNDYDYIDFQISPNFYKVAIGNFEFEFNQEHCNVYAKGVKWGIIDKNNTVVVPIIYDWIQDVENTFWVVYNGGTLYFDDDCDSWICKNAKLGVYNKNIQIVPTEYDTITNNWGRIKDYIFVQKGSDYLDETKQYDVFDFNGKQILWNKPSPKNHFYY